MPYAALTVGGFTAGGTTGQGFADGRLGLGVCGRRYVGWRYVRGWGFGCRLVVCTPGVCAAEGAQLEVWMPVGGLRARGLRGRRLAVGGLHTRWWFARRGFRVFPGVWRSKVCG